MGETHKEIFDSNFNSLHPSMFSPKQVRLYVVGEITEACICSHKYSVIRH